MRTPLEPKRTRPAPALPVYHGKGGLAAGLTGRGNKALLDAADSENRSWPRLPCADFRYKTI